MSIRPVIKIISILMPVALLCGCSAMQISPSSASASIYDRLAESGGYIAPDTPYSDDLVFENSIFAAHYLQNNPSQNFLQGYGFYGQRLFDGRYDSYLEDIDISQYTSVAALYSHEKKLKLKELGTLQYDADFVITEYVEQSQSQIFGIHGRVDPENYADWFVLSELTLEGYDDSSNPTGRRLEDLPFRLYPMLDLTQFERSINLDKEYLVVSFQRKIEQLTVYPGKYGREDLIPLSGYDYGKGTDGISDDDSQFEGYMDSTEDVFNPPYSARAILSRAYYPGAFFVYKMSDNIGFNVCRYPPDVYWEYTQVEI